MSQVATEVPVSREELCSRLEKIIGAEFTKGNRVDLLNNGVEIFPAMLQAIRNARTSVRFLTYVYWDGEIAEAFAETMAKKAREGVPCQILLDAWGSKKMRDEIKNRMREAGAQVALYNPFSACDRIAEYQHRTHRKILVCDGRVGFIGGVGIADEWSGDAQDSDHWHDYHFRLTGPAVEGLAKTFDDDWIGPRVEHENALLPIPDNVDPVGDESREGALPTESTAVVDDMPVLSFYSTPRDKESAAKDVFLELLHSAKKNIRIVTAYFIPQDTVLDALLEAPRRDVSVEVVLPGEQCDSWLARRSSQAAWGEVLEGGVRLFEYQPTMCHAKAVIIDDDLVTVGSINFDVLSLCLNDEANIVVRSTEFASAMIRQFEKEKEKCIELTLDKWRERGVLNRLGERLASRFPLPWWGSSSNY